jgi:hypothetical protein
MFIARVRWLFVVDLQVLYTAVSYATSSAGSREVFICN